MSDDVGRRRSRKLRWPAVAGAAALLIISIGALTLHRALRFDAPTDFWAQKGELGEVSVHLAATDSAYHEYAIVLTSTADYRVRGYLRVPREPGAWPALIVLGGIDTGKRAAKLINPTEPYVILGLDYPWEGSTRLTAWQFLVRVLAVRQAMLRTPSAMMLAIDYLARRPDVGDVEGSGVTLVGASFGAPLVTVAAALDSRVQPVVLVYGGGDFEKLIASNLEDVPGWLRGPVAAAGGWLTQPIEPLRYVGRIAPRPLILINGAADDRIPRESAELLYAAAGEPKRLIWLDTGHISPRNEALLDQVLQAAVDALADLRADRARNAG